MSMTDPIADLLARIRNAILARKQQIELPALEAQAAHRRAPEGRGLHSARVDAPKTRSRACSKLDASLRRPTTHNAIAGIRRVSRPGQRVYVRPRTMPQGPLGPRHRHPLHVAGRDDRQGSPRSKGSAASSSARSGESCRASDVSHSTLPEGRHASSITKDGMVSVKGPKGELARRAQPRRASSRPRTRARTCIVFERADDSRRSRAEHGLMRALLANMVKGVTDGCDARARDQRRRLPRRGRRARSSPWRSASRTRSCSSCPKGVARQGRQEHARS